MDADPGLSRRHILYNLDTQLIFSRFKMGWQLPFEHEHDTRRSLEVQRRLDGMHHRQVLHALKNATQNIFLARPG